MGGKSLKADVRWGCRGRQEMLRQPGSGRSNYSLSVRDYTDRTARLEMCLRAGQRGKRSPKRQSGSKRYCGTSHFEPELPAYAKSCFAISQSSCFPVSMELIRACGCRRKTCRARSLPNRWVSSGNHQGVSFNLHALPPLTWVPVTLRARGELWQRDRAELWSFYEAARPDLWCSPPPSPGAHHPISATPAMPLESITYPINVTSNPGGHSRRTHENSPGISLHKIKPQRCRSARGILGCLPRIISPFITGFYW